MAPRIDFIIVVPNVHLPKLLLFVKNLKGLGLNAVLEACDEPCDHSVITISLPNEVVRKLSDLYDIDLERRFFYLIRNRPLAFTVFKSNIRQLEVRRRDEVTFCEKIFILNKILESTRFGEAPEEYSLSKLQRLGFATDAFPIHDGMITDEPIDLKEMNDREKLAKYWANLGVWYMEQPIDLIEKYYGSEVAFYFAFMEFFNNMLLLAMLIGFTYFVLSGFLVALQTNNLSSIICKSNAKHCARCYTNKPCIFRDLSYLCSTAKWHDIFDNSLTIVFAIFMQIWTRFFYIYWKRNEYRLKLRWNVQNEEIDTEMRLKYKERATSMKPSVISGKMEPYVPLCKRIAIVTISVVATIFLILVVFLSVFTVMKFYGWILKQIIKRASLQEHAKIISFISGSILQVFFIKFLGKYYSKCAIWLTNLENPRTESEFETSVLHKTFLLSFVNNFTGFYYIAFFKGHFYTSPNHQNEMNVFQLDQCNFNCMIDLNMQLMLILLLKKTVGNVLIILKNKLTKLCKKKKTVDLDRFPVEVPQWRHDMDLTSPSKYHICGEMSEMVILYSYVAFFSVNFPLVPLFAFINNIFEVRLDAKKLTNLLKRPVPKRKAGIGSWNGIIFSVGLFSTVINALIMGITSDFIPKFIYHNEYGTTFDQYINFTYSTFATKDYSVYSTNTDGEVPEICYYKAKRYNHNHSKKYSLSTDYWTEIIYRFVFILLFEHVILLMLKYLSSFIPKIPTTVKQILNRLHQIEKKDKLLVFEKTQPKAKDDPTVQAILKSTPQQKTETNKSLINAMDIEHLE